MNLTVTKPNALRAHKKADRNGKKLLENLFGETVFQKTDITDRIKTVEDAFEETGRPRAINLSGIPEDLVDHFQAEYEMIVITEALNEGWEPDWTDTNQPKWRVWFKMSPSGFAFRFSDCGYVIADAGSGSRLHYETEAKANYSAKQFPDIWRKIQLN